MNEQEWRDEEQSMLIEALDERGNLRERFLCPSDLSDEECGICPVFVSDGFMEWSADYWPEIGDFEDRHEWQLMAPEIDRALELLGAWGFPHIARYLQLNRRDIE